MKEINVTIDLLSPTLLSNGEPEGLYDDAYIRDHHGLPYFPSKRLKGLLRESCLELLEWQKEGNNPSEIIDFIFGKAGEANKTTKSRIQITNGKIKRKQDWMAGINQLEDSPETTHALDSYFSHEVSQTKIGENGIAKDTSLRKFKLLKPIKEARFITTITCSDDLNENHISLLKIGLMNIRRVGTGRNRGWGKVKVILEDDHEIQLPEWSSLEFTSDTNHSTASHSPNQEKSGNINASEPFKKIALRMTTESPIIIPSWTGDENTVATKSYIPGSTIWGAIAGKYIQLFGKGQKRIMNDPAFRALFYNGGARFQAAYPAGTAKVYEPSPRHWVRSKLKPGDPYTNMYDNSVEFGKGIGKYISLDFENKKIVTTEIRKSQSFHNSRAANEKSRLAGTNLDGGIYYYESIDEGQTFYTEIKVIHQLESKLRELLEDEKLRIGKSKNNQFGKVSVEMIDTMDQERLVHEQKKVDLTFISPAVLINENGFSDVSKDQIAKSLAIDSDDIKKTDIRTEFIQRYQGNLNVHLSAYQAIAPGSSLRIEGLDESTKKKIKDFSESGIGLETEKGFGRFRIDPVTSGLRLNLDENVSYHIATGDKGGASQDIVGQLKLEIELKKAQQAGFQRAGTKKVYKNGVYQALNWLASCKGGIDGEKWEDFKNRSSKKVKEKFIKHHNLLEIYEKQEDTPQAISDSIDMLQYTAALAYVEQLKSNLNKKQ